MGLSAAGAVSQDEFPFAVADGEHAGLNQQVKLGKKGGGLFFREVLPKKYSRDLPKQFGQYVAGTDFLKLDFPLFSKVLDGIRPKYGIADLANEEFGDVFFPVGGGLHVGDHGETGRGEGEALDEICEFLAGLPHVSGMEGPADVEDYEMPGPCLL